MPIENYWLVENRVLITRLEGNITLDEFLEVSREGTRMIDSGIAPVYSVVDMTQLTHFPMRVNELKAIADLGTSSKLSWIMVYGLKNSLVQFFASVFTQILRTNYRVFKTQHEALDMISKLEGQDFPNVVKTP
jgi:hypothetical protein